MRILLVEDDKQIGSALVVALQDQAYTVDWVKEGLSGLNAAKIEKYSLVVLDLGLPKLDGFSVLKEIRAEDSKIPIIVITAKDQVEERIKGLDLGADDYMIKPFSTSEFLARLRALLRRSSGEVSSVLGVKGFSLDLNTCKIHKDNVEYSLTQKEFALMRVLMSKAGKVFSKNDLEEHLYGWGKEVSSNALEFTIHGLRKKLGKDIVKNIRGLGWMVNKE